MPFLPIKQVDLVELLTLKMVSESRVTWATSVSILVFLGRSVLDLGLRVRQMSDVRQTDIRQYHRLMPPPRGREHSNNWRSELLGAGGGMRSTECPSSSYSVYGLFRYLVRTMTSASTRMQTTAMQTGATIHNVSTPSLAASATSTCDDVISSMDSSAAGWG